MLSPYRVLDVTDEKGWMCGKILGDLGADVIKIERPGGDPGRIIGPFYQDKADPEKSLPWFAWNTGKRGITLDIESPDGQVIFKRLLRTADIVTESFPPGYLKELGLEYSTMERLSPRVILISITPFGQTGPYTDYRAPDIVAWAMSGQMYPVGSPDRSPLSPSDHRQAYLNAAASAAEAAVIALYHREVSNKGLHMDISVQESLAHCTWGNTSLWDMMKLVKQRGQTSFRKTRVNKVWPCKDGYVLWYIFSGGMKQYSLALVQWIDSEGSGNEYLSSFDWDAFDMETTDQKTIDSLEQPIGEFFMSHTKEELYEGAIRRRVMLFPISSAKDIAEDRQLSYRDFWTNLEHPELGTWIAYPGAFVKTTAKSLGPVRRAPLIAEHNDDIYRRELGFTYDEMATLKKARVI